MTPIHLVYCVELSTMKYIWQTSGNAIHSFVQGQSQAPSAGSSCCYNWLQGVSYQCQWKQQNASYLRMQHSTPLRLIGH